MARELIGYGLLLVLLAALGFGWLRWRRRLRQDRIMRWGTPHPPRRGRRGRQV